MEPIQHEVVLALGSNLGNRLASLARAVARLGRWIDGLIASRVYETAPRYLETQPQFFNMAVLGRTALAPTELLAVIQQIEVELGRMRLERYGPRHIDIDIIYYDRLQVRLPHLTVPHALRAERQFVLAPVADVVPDFVDPETGQTVRAMLHSLPAADDDCIPLGPFADLIGQRA